MAHVVIVGVHPVIREHAALVLGFLLVDRELALHVLHVVDAPQAVVLRGVPQLQPFAVLGGVVAGHAVALIVVGELGFVAAAVVDCVHERAELVLLGDVAGRVRMAEQALLHGHLTVQLVVPGHGMLVGEVLQQCVHVGMAGFAAAVVGVEPVGVVRVAARLNLPRVGVDRILGGRALHHLPVGKRPHLGRVLFADRLPTIPQAVDVLFARVGVLVDVGVGGAFGSVHDGLLLGREGLLLLALRLRRRAVFRGFATVGCLLRRASGCERDSAHQAGRRDHEVLVESHRSPSPCRFSSRSFRSVCGARAPLEFCASLVSLPPFTSCGAAGALRHSTVGAIVGFACARAPSPRGRIRLALVPARIGHFGGCAFDLEKQIHHWWLGGKMRDALGAWSCDNVRHARESTGGSERMRGGSLR